MVRGLVEEGADLRADHRVWHYRDAVSTAEREALADLMLPEPGAVEASIEHGPGRLLDPYAHGTLRIGRTALASLEVPADWVVRANQLDEVWTSNCTEAEALVAAGVARERVAVLPEALELDLLDPATRAARRPRRPRHGAAGGAASGERTPSGCSRRGARRSRPPTT